MPKQVVWVLIIATGVFLGVFGYEKFTEYRMQKLLDQELVKFQEVLDQSNAELEYKKNLEKYRNTACAINEAKNTCLCINEKTGTKIALNHDECVKRAKEITW